MFEIDRQLEKKDKRDSHYEIEITFAAFALGFGFSQIDSANAAWKKERTKKLKTVPQCVCHKSTQITEHFESISVSQQFKWFCIKCEHTNAWVSRTDRHRMDGNEHESVPRHGNVTKGVNLHQITQRLAVSS